MTIEGPWNPIPHGNAWVTVGISNLVHIFKTSRMFKTMRMNIELIYDRTYSNEYIYIYQWSLFQQCSSNLSVSNVYKNGWVSLVWLPNTNNSSSKHSKVHWFKNIPNISKPKFFPFKCVQVVFYSTFSDPNCKISVPARWYLQYSPPWISVPTAENPQMAVW